MVNAISSFTMSLYGLLINRNNILSARALYQWHQAQDLITHPYAVFAIKLKRKVNMYSFPLVGVWAVCSLYITHAFWLVVFTLYRCFAFTVHSLKHLAPILYTAILSTKSFYSIHRTIPYHTIPYHNIPHYTTLQYTILHYTTQHYAIPLHTIANYITNIQSSMCVIFQVYLRK